MNNQEFQVGEQILLGKELRILKEISKNVNGDTILLWSSKNSEGACLPSSWIAWRSGTGENY